MNRRGLTNGFRWLVSGSMCLLVTVAASTSELAAQTGGRQESGDPYYRPGVKATKPTGPVTTPSAKQQAETRGGEFSPAPEQENRFVDTKVVPKSLASSPGSKTTPVVGDSFAQGEVLAVVGSEPIFLQDMIIEIASILDQFIPEAPQEIKDRERKNLIPRLLPKYIEAKLMYVEFKRTLPDQAKLEDILVSAEEQFDELMLPKLIKASKVNSAADLDAQYRSQGSSLRKMRRSWTENELVKYAMRERIDVDPIISHREMFDVYQANKADYEIKAKVKWEQVMVRFDRFPSKQHARQAIAEIGNKIIGGAALGAIAKTSSHGYLASEGGAQGWTSKGSLSSKELDEALFEIEPNRLSDIIESDSGYHIVRVLERTPGGHVPFTEAQVEIREKLVEARRQESYKQFVAELRERIPVEILHKEAVAQQQDASAWK